MAHEVLKRGRIRLAKRAFSTRRVKPGRMRTLITGSLQPRPGDLVLARVDEIWNHRKLELTDGRRALMFPGDEIVVCYANRYAPDQFEAMVPTDLAPCDLVAAGGVASSEVTRHQRMKPPTRITPLGLIGDAEGNRLNVLDFRLDAPEHRPELPAMLALGTSMNAGKTLTSTSMVRGFKRAGLKVAALKITGTGAGGDMWIVRDAGADFTLDFTDAGYASTYLTSIDDIIALTYRLMNYAARKGAQVAVIEIADGLHQLETSQLVRRREILDLAVGTMFASYDAMGAVQGVNELRDAGHDILGLSGQLGRAPLGVREAEAATGLRVYSPWELQDGALVPLVRERAAARLDQEGVGNGNRYIRMLADATVPDAPAPDNLISLPGMPRPAEQPQDGKSLEQDILALAARCVMDADVDRLCGVADGKGHRNGRGKDEKRSDWRKGSRRATWDTDLGPIELKVPRLRVAAYEPAFLHRHKAPVQRIRSTIAADGGSRIAEVRSLLAAMTKRRISEDRLSDLVGRINSRMSVGRVNGHTTDHADTRAAILWPLEAMTSATEQDEIHSAELEVSLLGQASA